MYMGQLEREISYVMDHAEFRVSIRRGDLYMHRYSYLKSTP